MCKNDIFQKIHEQKVYLPDVYKPQFFRSIFQTKNRKFTVHPDQIIELEHLLKAKPHNHQDLHFLLSYYIYFSSHLISDFLSDSLIFLKSNF